MQTTKEKSKLYTNPLFVAAFAILCCALWGSATPFIKMGYDLILPPDRSVSSVILFAGIRFFFAGIITIIIYSIARKRFLYPQKRNLGKIATVSAFQTVIQYLFFYIGLANTSGVKGTIISGSNAFFAILVSAIIFKQEKLTPKKIVACLLGFAGIIIVNWDGSAFSINFTGDVFVLFSAISYAVSSNLMKKFSKDEEPVIISGYQFIMGGLFMIIVGVIFGGKILYINSLEAFAVMAYLALLSAVAYSVWGILLKYNPVSKVSIYSFMIPVFGVVLSAIILKEFSKISFVSLGITMVLVCVGILMINYTKQKKQQ